MPKITSTNLKIFLLGAPRVEWGEYSLAIKRRNVRGLLYRLATDLEFVPRASLCLLFWPDEPDANARRNLTHLLTHLRLELPDGKMLLTTEDMVGLDAQALWCDVVAFRHFTQSNQREIVNLRRAVEFYRGSFLTGFSLPNSSEFEHWVSRERSSLESLYLNALESLIDRELIEQNFEQAIGDTIRYLETDDLVEEMYRKLMVLYATVGDRNATLRQYERCVVVLERELGVSPLPNTRAIYQLMLDGHVPVISAPDEPFKFQSLRMPSPDFPLVGRESAWQNLEDALISARAGRGNVVFISGEAGIGKSRLMQDFITRYKSDACMFYGAGYSGGRTIPYLPLVEAIRFGRHHFPLTYNLHPIWLAEVSRLLPELRNQFPDLPAPLASDLEDARIRLLTIASYRHDEAEPTAEWRQLMSKSGIVSEIVLTGLDEIAIGNLVRRAFSHLAVNDRQIQLLKYASGDVQLHLLAFMEKVIGLNYSGRYIDVAASAEKGLILADSLGDQSSRLCFLAQLGLARYHMGEPRATLKPLEPARTLSEQEHDLEMRGDVSQFLGHVHFHLGNHAKALDFHLESLECSQELGDQTGLVWCSLNVGFLYLKLGCWDKSKEYLHQGLSLTRQIEFSGAEEFALTLLGQWELYRGNYLTAIDFFQQALPIHQAAHAEHNIAATEEPIGMVYYQLGDLNKAREWFGAHF